MTLKDNRMKLLAVLGFLVILAAFIWVLVGNKSVGNNDTTKALAESEMLAKSSHADEIPDEQGVLVKGVRNFKLKVENNMVVSGPTMVEVKLGENVLINLYSDNMHESEVLLEGYEETTILSGGTVGQLEFTANAVGAYNIKLTTEEELEKKEPGHILAKVVVK